MFSIPVAYSPSRACRTPSATRACALLGSNSSARSSSLRPRNVSPRSARAHPVKPSTSKSFGSSASARSAASDARCRAVAASAEQRHVGADCRPKREQRVCDREPGIGRDGQPELRDALLESVFAPAVDHDRADRLAIVRPGVEAVGAPPPDAGKLGAQQRRLQMRCELTRDLVLQRQGVAALRLVASGPELASVRFGKLRGDAQELIGGANASGDEVLHAQLVADPAQLVRRIPVEKRRCARDDEEARHAREQRRDILGQRVGEKARRRDPRTDWSKGSTAIEGRSAIGRQLTRRSALRSGSPRHPGAARRQSGSPCATPCGSAAAPRRCRRARGVPR